MVFGQNITAPGIAADLSGMALFSRAISMPAPGAAFITLPFSKTSDHGGKIPLVLPSIFNFFDCCRPEQIYD
jgi:hypothetical protein